MVSVLASALSLALVLPAVADPPDFTGTWRMDPARSVTAVQGEPAITSVTLVVAHEPDQVTVRTETPRGATTDVYRFTGGREASAPGRSIARWEGDVLELSAVRTISGQSVSVRQSWRLDSESGELHVESVLNVQHGYSSAGARVYGTGQDVYVRVP
jgi:hypothetical protein